ncbi:MAG: ABC-2 family transporter protein [Polyangiaceae bacterium]
MSQPERFKNVYVEAFKASLQAKFEYRVDLFVGVVTSLLLQGAALSFLLIVLRNSPTLAGWSGREVLFLFGMTAVSLGSSELLFNQIWLLPQYIVAGDLDRLLTYPVRSLLFFLVTRPELHAFGNLLTGVVYVVASLSAMHAPWYVWLDVCVWSACGTVIYTAALVLFGSLSFRWVGPFAQQLLIPLNLLQASRYPLPVYPGWLQKLLLFVIPYGTIHYLPGRVLFGKTASWWGLGAAPFAAALLALAAQAAWNSGLRQYESTGS